MNVNDAKTLTVDGVTIELLEAGDGKTLLFLQGVEGIDRSAAWLDGLAQRYHLIAPWHPGFGGSGLPREFRTVGDLAFFYLQLIDELELTELALIGASFGGWIAAEIAVRSTAAISHLVLLDPYGIKQQDREAREIADIYAMSQAEVAEHAYHDPAHAGRDYAAMTEAERLGVARSRETFTYFGWRPYMHDPSLRRWLRRIHIPTLVLWGESDRLVTPTYGRGYASSIPGARFEVIPRAGHYPHIEQPEATIDAVAAFVTSPGARANGVERNVTSHV